MPKVGDICEDALRFLRVQALGQAAEAEDIEQALIHYNSMMHELVSVCLIESHTDAKVGDEFPLEEGYRYSCACYLALRMQGIFSAPLAPNELMEAQNFLGHLMVDDQDGTSTPGPLGVLRRNRYRR